MARGPKVLVIGLDGGTLDLLGPWMREGLLPNLSTFQQEGVVERLRSTIPPVTAPAWASFQTGMNPGKHGLFDFIRYLPGSYNTTLVNSYDVGAPTLWRILSEDGKRVAVINTPLTYPPRPVNGLLVSGMLTPGTHRKFTYPPELAQELMEEIGEWPGFTPVRSFDYLGAKRFVDCLLGVLQKRTEAALYLLERARWDFFMVHFQCVDILQHALWAYIDPSHPAFSDKGEEERAYVQGFYRSLDRSIGLLLEKAAEDTLVILMSDHGFGPVTKRIYINQYLAQEGFLSRKTGLTLAKLWNSAEPFLRRLDFLQLRRRLIPPFTKRDRWVNQMRRDPLIDWAATRAFALSGSVCTGIYFNCVGREPEGVVKSVSEYEGLREEISESLYALTDPEEGERIIAEVYPKEKIYHGPFLEHLPDLVVKPADRYIFSEALGRHPLVEASPSMLTGSHRLNGLIMLKGPQIRRQEKVEGAEIIDLAPTILYALGVAIPEDMDGRVLEEAFHPSYLKAHPTCHAPKRSSGPLEREEEAYSDEEIERMQEHLRGLGYLD